MNIKTLIENNIEKIIPELFDWAETFDWELDEDGEKTLEPYYKVFSLAERLENGQCNGDDYKNILFHIEQINYNEIIIRL
ncbi:hypothetical protein [Parasediminibacterium sp. JCM 36343]|uniref:hypothetical protein n=1 Tax=Parasediminibacterium sp. JCM 36343 TaxID=3374279 RepID=UPI0039787A6C